MSDPRDELGGSLAKAEREHVARAPIVQARSHYDEVHAAAVKARDELRFALTQRAAYSTTVRLVNAHAWASRNLYLAAKELCRVASLPREGRDNGIEWEVSL